MCRLGKRRRRLLSLKLKQQLRSSMRYHYSRPECEAEPGEVLGRLLAKMIGDDVLEVPNVAHLATRWSDLKGILNILAQKTVFLEAQCTSGKRGEPREIGFKCDLRRAGAMRAKARGRYSRKGRPRCPRGDEA